MNINVLDLFSGTGGFSLGLKRAGFNIQNHYFSEVDKHAIANYSYNFPGAQYAGSVTDVRGADLGRIDAITFGSPCQDFSVAGKGCGLGGDRSSLIRHAIRLIRECRPKFFIWENVKGVFSSNSGADFAAIIQAFADIGGYRLEWQLLNTAWFIPQNRERIYLVGLLGAGSGRALFSDIEKLERATQGSEQAATVRTLTAGGNSGGMHSSMALVAEPLTGGDEIRTIRSGGRGSVTDKHSWDLIKVKSATSAGYEEAGYGDSINYSVPNSKTRRGRVGKGQTQTLDTACNQAVIDQSEVRVKGFRNIEGVITGHRGDKAKTGCSEHVYHTVKAKTAHTLTTRAHKLILEKNIESRIRRLTEIECERLQGFPDDWTKYGLYENKFGELHKQRISATQRYKMCGNAVTVDVVKYVGEQIIKQYQEAV